MTNYPVFEIAAADMNNDGTTGIVANGQSVIIFYGTRNRGFNSSTLAAAGDIAITPMLADFDGNGLKDVIYPSYNPTPGDNTIGVNALLQTSVGKFAQGKYVTFDSFNSGLRTGAVWPDFCRRLQSRRKTRQLRCENCGS